MRLPALIYICLLGVWLGLGEAFVAPALAQKAKTSKRVSAKKATSQKKKKPATKTNKRKKRTPSRTNKRQVRQTRERHTTADFTAERSKMTEADRRSGQKRFVAGRDVEIPEDFDALQKRFIQGDTTLSLRSIESLYFGLPRTTAEDNYFHQIETEVDQLIKKSRYSEALRLAERSLERNPIRLSLLKRACDLAQHEQSKHLDLYVWQVAEILFLIEHTGDGKTHETAYRVMSKSDALLYETLWLDTPMDQIVSQAEDKSITTLTIRNHKTGEELTRHYSIRQH